MLRIAKICILVQILVYAVYCVKVKFERAYVESFNPKYFNSFYVNVSRYARRSDYYINLEFDSKYRGGNNVTVSLLGYEYRRNEYKRSIAQFRYKLCDFINKDPYFGNGLRKSGIPCPVIANKYTIMNLTVYLENLPSAVPFEKGRANLFLNGTSSREFMCEIVFYVTLYR